MRAEYRQSLIAIRMCINAPLSLLVCLLSENLSLRRPAKIKSERKKSIFLQYNTVYCKCTYCVHVWNAWKAIHILLFLLLLFHLLCRLFFSLYFPIYFQTMYSDKNTRFALELAENVVLRTKFRFPFSCSLSISFSLSIIFPFSFFYLSFTVCSLSKWQKMDSRKSDEERLNEWKNKYNEALILKNQSIDQMDRLNASVRRWWYE